MNTFYCACCGLTCQSSRAYTRHLKSARHIKRKTTVLDHLCICKKSFSTSSALYRHRKTCSIYQNNIENTSETNNGNIEEMEQIIETLVEKKYGKTLQTLETIKEKDDEIKKICKEKDEIIREKEQQIQMLLSEKNTTNNIETQNVIVINNFGEEKIDYISIQDILQMINDKPARSPVLLAQKIHFDNEHPENNNVAITGEKSNYAYIHKNGRRVREYRKNIINEMAQNSFDIIEKTYDDNVNVFSHSKQNGVKNLKNRFYNNDIKYLTDEIDLMVLNECAEVKQTP